MELFRRKLAEVRQYGCFYKECRIYLPCVPQICSLVCCSKCPVVLQTPCRCEVTAAICSVEMSRCSVVVVVVCDKRC